MVVGFVCLFVITKFVVNSNNNGEIDDAAIIEETDAELFEDKFERLWVIGTTRDYTEEDFEGWNKDDLKILRNYFFAKVNYVFAAKDLNEYFSRYSWYQGLYVDVIDDLDLDIDIDPVFVFNQDIECDAFWGYSFLVIGFRGMLHDGELILTEDRIQDMLGEGEIFDGGGIEYAILCQIIGIWVIDVEI